MSEIRSVSVLTPFRWLALGWGDFMRGLVPCLVYGLLVAATSFVLWRALIESNLAFWALILSCGFVFIAPMLAMGLYEAGRRLEAGERPTLFGMIFVRAAVRLDVFYLGLALLLIYLLWGRIAQIVYGLSTYRLHKTVPDFIAFAVGTSDGHAMLISGTIVGGILAFFTFALTVVAAPMLLDREASVFEAMFKSLQAVSRNFLPMLVWAALITALLLVSAATAWLALAIVFPWLGLATWRAYRAIIGP